MEPNRRIQAGQVLLYSREPKRAVKSNNEPSSLLPIRQTDEASLDPVRCRVYSHESVMRTATPSDSISGADGARRSFETTRWSVVLAAGDDPASSHACGALETLCRTYWKPLYVYVRRQGYSDADAKDLVQGFFARILARRDLQAVRRERGRFRSYLLAALKNFLVNDWKHAAAEKRGGGHAPSNSTNSVTKPPQHSCLRGIHARIRRTISNGRTRCCTGYSTSCARNKSPPAARHTSRACGRFSPTRRNHGRTVEIAAELGLSEGAVKQAVFRLRQRYKKLLRAEVANTVATFSDVDQELRHLAAALRS